MRAHFLLQAPECCLPLQLHSGLVGACIQKLSRWPFKGAFGGHLCRCLGTAKKAVGATSFAVSHSPPWPRVLATDRGVRGRILPNRKGEYAHSMHKMACLELIGISCWNYYCAASPVCECACCACFSNVWYANTSAWISFSIPSSWRNRSPRAALSCNTWRSICSSVKAVPSLIDQWS